MGPRPEDEEYDSWLKNHMCQKTPDVKSGRMEVGAALILFVHSVSKHNLRYTTLVSDGDCATYSALVGDNVYGLVPVVKEECLNHIQKRMWSGLNNLVQKSDKPLGGKGRLTKALIEKPTGYYGWALRNNLNDGAAMQRAVMATLYHATSTGHHDLTMNSAQRVPSPSAVIRLPRQRVNPSLSTSTISQAKLLQLCCLFTSASHKLFCFNTAWGQRHRMPPGHSTLSCNP